VNRKWPAEDPLGFGFGDHRCIAEHLAKAELATVFCTCWKPDQILTGFTDSSSAASLYQKLPDLKVAVPLEKVNYTPLSGDVGIVDLPVTF
jgi:nitric oxide reductase